MSCLPCSKVSKQEQNVVKYYQNLEKTTNKRYYVYRLSAQESFSFVEKSYFNMIFDTQIKPNFEHGAEYFSISEFKGN